MRQAYHLRVATTRQYITRPNYVPCLDRPHCGDWYIV